MADDIRSSPFPSENQVKVSHHVPTLIAILISTVTAQAAGKPKIPDFGPALFGADAQSVAGPEDPPVVRIKISIKDVEC